MVWYPSGWNGRDIGIRKKALVHLYGLYFLTHLHLAVESLTGCDGVGDSYSVGKVPRCILGGEERWFRWSYANRLECMNIVSLECVIEIAGGCSTYCSLCSAHSGVYRRLVALRGPGFVFAYLFICVTGT